MLPTMAEMEVAVKLRAADKRCREVGIATMMVGALPAMAGVFALALQPLVTSNPSDFVGGFVALLIASAFVGLGYAMLRRMRWSFKVAALVFTLIAGGALCALFLSQDGGRVSFMFAVALPLVFAASAVLAERSVVEYETLRDQLGVKG